jgi:hypothetical protein
MDKLFELVKELPKCSGKLMYAPMPGENGHRSLEMVYAFIQGYVSGDPQSSADIREGVPRWLSVFTPWVLHRYGDPMMACNGFTRIKLAVGGIDELAYDEFYRLLPLYEKDIKEIGLDGIMQRQHELSTELRAQNARGRAEPLP